MKGRVILAGGSGFVGRNLTPALLGAGYDVTVLTRSRGGERGDVTSVAWDGKTLGDWARSVDGAAAIINLAGRSINCRHTPENRRAILDSRVDSVRVLGQAIEKATEAPAVFVQAAAVGIYGNAGDRWLDESAPHGSDFVAEVCRKWEQAFHDVPDCGERKVLLRLGVVLGRDGGFLQVLTKMTRLFLGGHVGDGKQFISWVHEMDVTRIFMAAASLSSMHGTYNVVSPTPVTNAEFMRELRRTLRRPWSPPVPKFAVQIGSRMIGTEPSLAFASQRAEPKRLLAEGFGFDFPELGSALRDLLRSPGKRTKNLSIWGAQAASLWLPAACRQRPLCSNLRDEVYQKRRGKLPRPTGWQPVLPG